MYGKFLHSFGGSESNLQQHHFVNPSSFIRGPSWKEPKKQSGDRYYPFSWLKILTKTIHVLPMRTLKQQRTCGLFRQITLLTGSLSKENSGVLNSLWVGLSTHPLIPPIQRIASYSPSKLLLRCFAVAFPRVVPRIGYPRRVEKTRGTLWQCNMAMESSQFKKWFSHERTLFHCHVWLPVSNQYPNVSHYIYIFIPMHFHYLLPYIPSYFDDILVTTPKKITILRWMVYAVPDIFLIRGLLNQHLIAAFPKVFPMFSHFTFSMKFHEITTLEWLSPWISPWFSIVFC